MEGEKMKKNIIFVSILLLVCFSYINIFGECIQGDCKNGQGTFNFSNGREYVGEWKDDKRDGQGTIIYPDGKKWVGRVKDGKPTGR
jgi:hypothetical protein